MDPRAGGYDCRHFAAAAAQSNRIMADIGSPGIGSHKSRDDGGL